MRRENIANQGYQLTFNNSLTVVFLTNNENAHWLGSDLLIGHEIPLIAFNDQNGILNLGFTVENISIQQSWIVCVNPQTMLATTIEWYLWINNFITWFRTRILCLPTGQWFIINFNEVISQWVQKMFPMKVMGFRFQRWQFVFE